MQNFDKDKLLEKQELNITNDGYPLYLKSYEIRKLESFNKVYARVFINKLALSAESVKIVYKCFSPFKELLQEKEYIIKNVKEKDYSFFEILPIHNDTKYIEFTLLDCLLDDGSVINNTQITTLPFTPKVIEDNEDISIAKHSCTVVENYADSNEKFWLCPCSAHNLINNETCVACSTSKQSALSCAFSVINKTKEEERIAREKEAEEERVAREKDAEERFNKLVKRVPDCKKISDCKNLIEEFSAYADIFDCSQYVKELENKILSIKNDPKRKKKIRLISILSSVAVVVIASIITLICILDYNARDGLKMELKGDYYVVTGIDGNAKSSYNIPSSYMGKPVKAIGEDAFYDCNSLTSIEIPDSVTSIGSSAFSGCRSLTSIKIPDSVTSIGYSAFYCCDSLTSIEIPDSVTSIGRDAFAGCDKLTIYCEVTSEPSGWYRDYYNDIMWNYDRPVVWGYAGEKGVTENGYVWALTSNNTITITGYSSNSTELIIPEKINGYSVTSIGSYAFVELNSLTSVEIPDSVTSIGFSAFAGCDKLTIYCEVTSEPSGWSSYWKSSNCPIVWDCKNNNVANDGYVYGITIDGINYAVRYGTAKVVGTTASGDTAIPSSIIYNSTTYEVTSIGSYAFYNCSILSSITIPTSVTSIGEYAFYNCDSLTSIKIPNSVTSIRSYAFSNCDSLASIELSDSVTSIGSYTFNGCDNLTIYCEVASRPSGWDSYWIYLNYGSSTSCPVVWGYKGE